MPAPGEFCEANAFAKKLTGHLERSFGRYGIHTAKKAFYRQTAHSGRRGDVHSSYRIFFTDVVDGHDSRGSARRRNDYPADADAAPEYR